VRMGGSLSESPDANERSALKKFLESAKLVARQEGDSRAITWFLEKMDRAAYGPQPPVVSAAQQNNYLQPATAKHAGADEIADFITAQRQRMALVRSLRLSDPEKAAATTPHGSERCTHYKFV
jgi:hypothetical protein